MIQSGELYNISCLIAGNIDLSAFFSAKYPLVIINKLLDDIGPNIGCTYDIGCTFSKTLATSSLGLRAANQNFRLMVGAFQGYVHNRGCQLSWHPLYIKGTGLTEGEGCKHIFSLSNDLARNTQHGSTFHRHQAIDEHFKFWDADKYALLSKCSGLVNAVFDIFS